MDTLLSQLQRNIQALIGKYDAQCATVVAYLPAPLHSLSVFIGRATLPIYWAVALIGASFIVFPINAQLSLAGLASLSCIPLATILKLVVRRHRPKTLYAQQMKIKSFSFPSSHAYSATVAGGYFAILSLAMLPTLAGYLLASILTLFIATVGVSRVHVGAHYPSDVSAGWLLGVTMLYAVSHLILQ